MKALGSNIAEAFLEEVHRLNHTKYINVLISGDRGMLIAYADIIQALNACSPYERSLLRFFIADDFAQSYEGNGYQQLGERSQFLHSQLIVPAVKRGLLEEGQFNLYHRQRFHADDRKVVPGLELLNRSYLDFGHRIDIAIVLGKYDGSVAGVTSYHNTVDWNNNRYFLSRDIDGNQVVSCSLRMLAQASSLCVVADCRPEMWWSQFPDLLDKPDRNFIERCGRTVPCLPDRQEFFLEEKAFPLAVMQFNQSAVLTSSCGIRFV